MLFTTDKQTLDDLNIMGKKGDTSLFALFNHCATRGGEHLLEEMFEHPLSSDAAINARLAMLRYFSTEPSTFPFDMLLFDSAEHYLSNTDARTKLSAAKKGISGKVGRLVARDIIFKEMERGVLATGKLLRTLQKLVHNKLSRSGLFTREIAEMQLLFKQLNIALLPESGQWSEEEKIKYDTLFRFQERDAIDKLFRHIYLLDVYYAVALTARQRQFSFPSIATDSTILLSIHSLYHPALSHPVANDLTVTTSKNVIFLTGANMAGKSTFMKSLSIALFLAHMGFPVPAAAMQFARLDGMFTTINLPDNLGNGASHFYAEVLRLKKVANELEQSHHLFVLFDELFRGTNVKDAYEATIEVTSAFATRTSSIFVISTHIVEAGPVLQEQCNNIRFLHLPTRMNGSHPEYTYTLEEGITDDRHGMLIVQNEGIIDILKKVIKKQIAS